MTPIADTFEPALAYDDPRHLAAAHFLVEEAALLDARRWHAWLALLGDDVRYVMPVRVTTGLGTESRTGAEMAHFDEDRSSLTKRVERLMTEHFGTGLDFMMLVVRGDTLEEVLETTARATEKAQARAGSSELVRAESIVSVLPPRERQLETIAWLDQHRGDLLSVDRVRSVFSEAAKREGLRPEAFDHGLDLFAQAASITEPVSLDDLRVDRPPLGAMAVDLARARPRLAGLEDDALRAERDPHEVGQRAALLGVPGHEEVVGHEHSLPQHRATSRSSGHCVLRGVA